MRKTSKMQIRAYPADVLKSPAQFGEGEDFNSFPCDFQNNAFCGPQVANWAGSVWHNWPVSQWGLRVKYALSSEVYAQVGAFEVNPSNLEVGNGFKLSGSGTEGALIPVEVVWSPKVNGLRGSIGWVITTARPRLTMSMKAPTANRRRCPAVISAAVAASTAPGSRAATDHPRRRRGPWPERVLQCHRA